MDEDGGEGEEAEKEGKTWPGEGTAALRLKGSKGFRPMPKSSILGDDSGEELVDGDDGGEGGSASRPLFTRPSIRGVVRDRVGGGVE